MPEFTAWIEGPRPGAIASAIEGDIAIHRPYSLDLSPPLITVADMAAGRSAAGLLYQAKGWAATHIPTGSKLQSLYGLIDTRKRLIDWARIIQALEPDAWVVMRSLPHGVNVLPPEYRHVGPTLIAAGRLARDLTAP